MGRDRGAQAKHRRNDDTYRTGSRWSRVTVLPAGMTPHTQAGCRAYPQFEFAAYFFGINDLTGKQMSHPVCSRRLAAGGRDFLSRRVQG